MHTIGFLTEKTNRYTTFYCLFGIIMSAVLLVLGVRWIIPRDGLDGWPGVVLAVFGIVIGLSSSWNLWVMRNEVIGLELDRNNGFTLLRPSGQMQRNVQLTSRLFTFGCIRFGVPNDAGRIDYVVVRTSVGTVAIPVQLYNKAATLENA